MDLRGKVAVITGASSGIGAALARQLVARGAKVTLTARRQERLEALAVELSAAGGEALVCPADLRREEELVRVFPETVARFGRLDVLVNNAGLGRKASLHEGETERWREMFEVNVLALSVATREALSRFDPERGGHVVHIGSMAGHRVPPGGGFYSATKFAVRALTEGLRQELRARGSKSRVSVVSPGFCATEFFEVYHDGDREQAAATLGRFPVLQAEDVARSVVHLLEAPDHVSIHDVLLRPTAQPT